MEVIRSNKGGLKLCYEQYMYTKKSASKSSIFWTCTNRTSGCSGSLRTNLDITDVVRGTDHDHPPNELKISVVKVRAEMKRLATQSNDKPSVVYANSIMDAEDNALACLPSAEVCKRTIRNQRNPEFPKVPDTCREILIEGKWSENANGDEFLFYDSGPDSESRVIAFATQRQLQLPAESNQWLMDGNFAMSPTQFAQLFVIQVALSESAVPCVFALLQDKRQTTYETLFQAIIDKCTNLGYQPDPISVMVDFEIGLRQALSSVLGDHIHIQGCFYHLSQATWRKIQELGLTDTYKNSDEFKQFCGMLDGLAFLPVRDVAARMEYIQTLDAPNSEELVTYFDTTYVARRYRNILRNGWNIIRRTPAGFPPPDWNVHDATVSDAQRTNNQCEGWNNRFTHLVGHHHPHIWKLIKFLKLEERSAATAIAQHQIGNLQPRKKHRKYVNLQSRLRRLCVEYNNGERDIENFLNAVGHTIRFEK